VVRAERDAGESGGGDGGGDGGDGDGGGRGWRTGAHVGTIVGVIPCEELTGRPDLGNDLLEVALGEGEGERSEGEGDNKGEGDPDEQDADSVADVGAPDTVLVPFVPQIVVEVRLAEGVVLVDPPDGLLELIQPKRLERVVIRGLLPERAASLLPRG
jgi:hypothetical protein